MNVEGYNRVFMVNDGINNFLKLDKRAQLKKVNLGIRTFQRCKNKHNGTNIVYRITQEGLQSLFPCFTKRKLRVSIDTLMYMTDHQNIKVSDVPEDMLDLKAIVEDPLLGYFALYVEENGQIIEMTTLLKFKNSVILMASDEMVGGLRVKYRKDFVYEETPKPLKKNEDAEAIVEDK